jgi:hypothetical protein
MISHNTASYVRCKQFMMKLLSFTESIPLMCDQVHSTGRFKSIPIQNARHSFAYHTHCINA